jgi:hypothetical protein
MTCQMDETQDRPDIFSKFAIYFLSCRQYKIAIFPENHYELVRCRRRCLAICWAKFGKRCRMSARIVAARTWCVDLSFTIRGVG